MLARRIIPCLDVSHGRVVKGQQFKALLDVADPAELGKRYALEGADELVFYDITASNEARDISLQFVSEVAKEINIPFCVGGGVRTVDDFHKILRQGADKVSVNTAAVLNPALIEEAANRYGSQCVVLSIDAKKVGDRYVVYTHGGRTPTDLDAIAWAIEGVRLGAGEIVINAIDTDGLKTGYDLRLIKQLTDVLNVPVIASGGAGEIHHFVDAAKVGADGILAASVFHYGLITIDAVKAALLEAGIPARLERSIR